MTTMPTTMKRGFVDTPDGQIHYWSGGSGDPLLLLHQTPRSSWEFVRMLPILIQHRSVVAIDSIGYGDSDKPPREYSIEDYAKSSVAVLDALGIQRTSIAGFHTGAYIGTEVAAAYPDRVDKLVLGGPFNMDAEERERQAGKWPNFESKEDGSHLAREWKTSLLLGDMDLAHQRMLDILKTGKTMAYGWWAVIKYHQEERLPLLQCPTLLIWGGKDLELTETLGWKATAGRPKVEQAISRAKVVNLPDGSPFFPLDAPEEFSRLILEFCDNPGV